MRAPGLITLLLSAAAAWNGCVSANEAGQLSASRVLPLKLQWTNDHKCLVAANQRMFALPAEQGALHIYLTSLASSKDLISLSGDVRHECVAQVMAAAKRSGIKRLGYISEPQSPQPR